MEQMALFNRKFSRENAHVDGDHASTNDNRHIDEEENNFKPCDEEEVPMPKFNFAHFLNNRLSYSKLRPSARKGFVGQSRSSRFSPHYKGDEAGWK